ncbi:MAG: InlB B-repeat-containing protein [Clostridiales bacterium]|nr:InlB B-repeat-containing protein [Clostridiales bacterium]
MAKRIKTILCIIIIGIVAALASACSFFDEEGAGRQISRIYSIHSDEEKGTYIVIEYVGDEYDDDMFFIADQEKGDRGNGIDHISSRQSEDGTSTILTIYYTDISLAPQEITLPTGTYIVGIDTNVDPDTRNVTLTIRFSDDSIEPLDIVIEAAKDGRDGDTIKDIFTDEDEEGNVVVHIVYSKYDEETGEMIEDETTFTLPKGAQGTGIKSIDVNYQTFSDPSNIYLDIFYDDDTFKTITVPKTNSWYTGSGAPGESQYNVGDFYIDTTNYRIYRKMSASDWSLIIDLGAYKTVAYSVVFYTDNGANGMSYTITGGHSFKSSNMTVPTPVKTGYKFMGWYTEYVDPNDSKAEPSPNSGHFTDLTVVSGNLVLYAYWKKI